MVLYMTPERRGFFFIDVWPIRESDWTGTALLELSIRWPNVSRNY